MFLTDLRLRDMSRKSTEADVKRKFDMSKSSSVISSAILTKKALNSSVFRVGSEICSDRVESAISGRDVLSLVTQTRLIYVTENDSCGRTARKIDTWLHFKTNLIARIIMNERVSFYKNFGAASVGKCNRVMMSCH